MSRQPGDMIELEIAGYKVEPSPSGGDAWVLRRFSFGRMETIGIYSSKGEAVSVAIARIHRGE